MNKQAKIMTGLLVLIGLILLFELFRDARRAGDFIGYVNAGNAVLHGGDIYSDYLNTWPPVFSVFSVIIALMDRINPYFVRFIWLLGSIAAMYFIVKTTVALVLSKTLGFKEGKADILWRNPIIVVPLLIILRYIMDNLSNVQINIYMFWAALMSFIFFIQKKYIWMGFLLGLTISLKVYTIFILFYFLYKREFKPVLWTIFFVLLINSLSFIFFGYDQGIAYYHQWITEIAPRSFIAHHKNQSIFGMFLRLFTDLDPSNGFYINILHLKPHFVKILTYVTVAVVAILPGYLFRKKLTKRNSLHAILEYTFVLTAIPILSPIAWKAYFIFLWMPYFLLYWLLYHAEIPLPLGLLKKLRLFYWLSVILTVFSTEAFVGRWFSDILENLSVITIGTVILLGMELVVYGILKKGDI